MRVCSHCRRCYDDQVEFCTESDHPALSETRGGSRKMVPGYRLDRLIESGLKGDLYRGRQVECGQSCRIRIVSPRKKSGQQFLREAKHAAALFSPNLVDVFDTGALDSGELYVVSEEAEGQTLREYLTAVRVPPLLSTIQLMEQTAEALHAVHQEGLLHRALRPENIVVTADVEGQPLVRINNIDFGGLIERSIVGNKFLIDTALDAVKYFAPEQFTGGRTSVESDVYALGIILYEMLAGAPPFDGVKASVLIEKHRHQKPKEIRIDNFDLRALLTHTLVESLQKEPEKRHGSAQAFSRQLRHMEQLATHVSTPPPAITVPPVPIMPKVAKASAAAVLAKPNLVESVQESELPAYEVVEPIHEDFVPELVGDQYDPWTQADVGSSNDESVVYRLEPVVHAEKQIEEVLSAPSWQDENLPKSRLERPTRRARVRLRKNRSRAIDQPQTREESAPLPEPERSDQPLMVPEQQPEIAVNNEPSVVELPVQSDVLLPIPNFVEPVAEEITAVTARSTPSIIEWQQPEDDIPSLDDVVEELAKENATPSFDLVPTPKRGQKPARQTENRSSKSREEIQFFPAVMRKSNERGSIDLYPNYSILAGYGAAQTRFSFDYQTLVLGAGLIALVLLFFVGSSMYRQQYVTSQPPVTPPSIGSVFSEPEQPQIAQTNPVKKAAKTSQKTKADEVNVGDNSISTSAISEAKPQQMPAAQTQDQALKNPAPTRTVSKPATVSSTLVISTENGKVKSTVETGRRPADSKPPIATNIVTGTGRPRIAGNQMH